MAVATEALALVATVELTVRFLLPVKMDGPLTLEAWDTGVLPQDPRRRGAQAKLSDARGVTLATASGVYQPIPAEQLERFIRKGDSQ